MFDMDDLFLDESFGFDSDDTDATLTTTEEGFVWCDCAVDESQVIDGDPFEFITEAMYQNVVNANNISLAILADNYKYLRENGVELVTEAEEAEKQANKKWEAVKAFFKKIKDKIAQFFETIISKMAHLQTKFLMLFKKAKAAAAENYRKLDKAKYAVPTYTPKNIVDWAERQFKSLLSDDATSTEFPDADKTEATEINFEINNVIKNYGSYIKDVKKLKKSAIRSLDQQEKDALKANKTARMTDPLNADARKDVKQGFAKRANAVAAVSKTAINLIMKRVNASAKLINAAVFYKEKDKKDNKKQATGESASFLDRIEMI